MRFKVDENLPIEVADRLRENAHDASTVLQEGLGGQPDVRISQVCKDEQRSLITLDTDFSDIRTYPPGEYPGIIVLRLKRHEKGHVLSLVDRLVRLVSVEPLAGHLWIVEENRVRILGPNER